MNRYFLSTKIEKKTSFASDIIDSYEVTFPVIFATFGKFNIRDCTLNKVSSSGLILAWTMLNG